MKLRFKKNSLRLRLNRQEVAALAVGTSIEERVEFPGGALLTYRLSPEGVATGSAELSQSTITIHVPAGSAQAWEASEEIGLYYRSGPLEMAIEKDLECTESRSEERDPHAYPRKVAC
jgi:hypothetical protein